MYNLVGSFHTWIQKVLGFEPFIWTHSLWQKRSLQLRWEVVILCKGWTNGVCVCVTSRNMVRLTDNTYPRCVSEVCELHILYN